MLTVSQGRKVAKKKSTKSNRLQDVTPEDMERQCGRVDDLIAEIRSLARQVKEAGFDSINMDGSQHVAQATSYLSRYAQNISRYLTKAKLDD